MGQNGARQYCKLQHVSLHWPRLASVSVGADPAAMIVEGQGVFRAVWVPGHVSGLKRVTNSCVEWQDAEGAYHRDGDLPTRI